MKWEYEGGPAIRDAILTRWKVRQRDRPSLRSTSFDGDIQKAFGVSHVVRGPSFYCGPVNTDDGGRRGQGRSRLAVSTHAPHRDWVIAALLVPLRSTVWLVRSPVR